MNEQTDLPPSSILQSSLSPGPLYSIAIPSGYSDDRPVPLILALHYGGHGQPFFGRHILTGLVEPALRSLQAIIVSPDCTGDSWTDPQSETDVFLLLDAIVQDYNIDTTKTLVTGYSMGGIGAWYLSVEHPDRFSAAVVMAGYPPFEGDDVRGEQPLYVIHSRQDEVVPLAPTQEAVKKLRDQGLSVEFVLLDDVTHYEVDRFYTPLKEAVPWIEQVWK